MNTQSIISIEPTHQPSGVRKAKEILSGRAIADRPIGELKKIVKTIFGVSGSAGDSRRQWSFRVILGAILMCFGLLFFNGQTFHDSEKVIGGIAAVMVAGGAFISVGLFTRIVSLAVGVCLMVYVCGIGLSSMTAFSMIVCVAVCAAGLLTGSGRYSLDTLIYNRLVGGKKRNSVGR